jgi:alkylation response protein AidB-like acyl-CoA dehydrogenase
VSVKLTQEQREFGDLAKTVLAKACSAESLMQERDGEPSQDRWAPLVDIGLTGATVPDAYGGLGLDSRDLVLVAEEVGYSALPEPLIETACVAVPILVRHAPQPVVEEWLPRIAAGDAMISIQPEGTGAATFGQSADLVLVVEEQGVAVCRPEEARAVALDTSDVLRRPARVSPGPGAVRFGDARVAAELTARATAWTSAVLNGVSRRLLDMSVDYAKIREQFGRPIGGFQAIKHMVANVAAEVETARPSAWHAVGLEEAVDELTFSASVAKWSASTAASTANYAALQVHGGIGFTRENPLSIWLLRGKKLESQWGNQQFHARLLGEHLMRTVDVVAEFGPVLTSQAL